MSLHKLTAGDGYTYLTRQVAAADSTERGSASLGEYYTEKGESPGQWMGSGLGGLVTVAAGSAVSQAQMKALFGEGRHPDADTMTEAMIAEGTHPVVALAQTRLGSPYVVREGSTEFRTVVAQRFVAHNVAAGLRGNTAIDDEVRARIRTEVGTALFGKEYGRPPADERELSGFIARGSRQGTTAVAGYDLTFSPVKSVSTLWAVAPRQVSREIEAAHQAAVADVIGWLETHAAYTRLGAHGVRQVDTTGLIGAAFTHRDSRAGDPDLHTHVAISNKVQTRDTDGTVRWLALDGRVIHKAAVAASERYNTRLEAHLVDRLGVSFAQRPGMDPAKRTVREIVGVDEELSGVWSARRASIDTRRAELAAAFQTAHGRAPSAVEALALAQQATLETRDAKHEPRSHAEQRQQWRTEAVDVLGGEPQLTAMIHTAVPAAKPQMSARVDEGWINQTAGAVIRTVSDARATWQPDHIRAEAERAARATGVKLGELDDTVDAIVTAALGADVSVPLSAPALGGVAEPAALRRADGASVYTTARTQLYTSQAVMDAEARLLAAAQRTDGRVTSSGAVDMALLESAANGVDLNPGQVALVRELATSGARLQVALAPAGTGKTTAMSALARAWAEDGGHVVGLAPTAAAAAVLGGDLHTPTDTLDKLAHVLGELGDPDRADTSVRVPQWVADIGRETLVIVDEAAMSGTPNLDVAVAYVLGRGGSVRLVGDDQQLASVSAGGVVRDIAETVGAVTLSEVMRFTDPAEGAASLAIRAGDPAGIGYYIDHDRVHVGDPATVLDQAYAGWAVDRAAGLDAVMLAPTKEAVTALNDRARTDRLAAADTPPGREVTLRTGSKASAGDMITTRRNDRRLVLTHNDWVRNGDRWTVRDVGADGSVRAQHVGTNRVITLPADYVADQVELGYARTVHAAQGLTADTAHSVATGEESRQLLYVAMTRGRGSNQLYVQTTGEGDPHSVITPEGLRPPTAVDVLTRVVGYDGAQRSAHTTARELADPVTQMEHAAGSYEDAVAVAAETLVGPEVLAAIDTAAEDIQPGLTAAPAYPTLRAHLAVLHLQSRNPVTALRTAAQFRELDTADDVAAVLDWRLDTTGRHSGKTGPLPWLPGLPAPLVEHPQWGPYLSARERAVTDTAAAVAAQAREFTPTSAPLWARSLVGENPDLLARLAVWRAATGVQAADRRPTGPDALRVAVRRYQKKLDAQVQRVLGDPHAAAQRWAPLANSIDQRLVSDPYWPVLAEHLTAAHRAGIDIGRLAVDATRDRPLPDELPGAALWWRLSQHLAPSVLDAAAVNAPQTLRPDWTPALSEMLGDTVAQRVLADPAWPGLVTAVTHATHAGWEPAQVLGTAHELLLATLDEDTVLRPAEVAPALVSRVQALLEDARHDPTTTAAANDEAVTSLLNDAPVDPEDEEAAAALAERASPSSAVENPDTTLAGEHVELGTDDDYLTAVAATEPAGDPETAGHPTEAGGDWDGALLIELPYTDLTPAEQVEAITTDLAAAREQLRHARQQLFDGTSPHLQATMPMIAAMRQRADDLMPAAVADADAHQEWIDADHTVEVAEHTAAQLAAELGAARTAGDDGRVGELRPLHALAADRVDYARSEAAARRADYDTAHHTLVEQAGPTGITTPQDVEFARIAATDLDLSALATHRDRVCVLEGALLRAETHAARDHALTQPALSTAPGVQEQRGVQERPTADTTTQGVRPGQRSSSAELVNRVQLTQPDRSQPMQAAAQPQDTEADPEASQTLGWRTGLGPRPEDPAQARQWAFTMSMVDTYRSDYHITSTDPSAPLGAPPPPGSEQASAYQAVNREWKAMAMTSAQDTPEAASDVQRRLADLDQRLTEVTQHRDADADLEDEVDDGDYEEDYQEGEGAVVQDGITDEHGFGYGTGYTDRHRGDGQGSHMGY
jgi:conjugative relaxase-like TrwC/TraI family protein